jgi:hypothetical protein
MTQEVEQLYRVYEQQEPRGKYYSGLTLGVAKEVFNNMVKAGYKPVMEAITNSHYYREDN